MFAVADDTAVRTARRRPTEVTEPLVVAGAGLAAAAFVGLVDPHDTGIYPDCPSQRLFGVACPLCGGLRGTNDLVHGDLGSMVATNALLPFLVLAAGWAWLAWTAGRVGWRWVPAFPDLGRRWRLLTTVIVVFTVVRNLPWAPFDALAP